MPTHRPSPNKTKRDRPVRARIRRVLLVVAFKPDVAFGNPLHEEAGNQLVPMNTNDSFANVLSRIVGAFSYDDVTPPNVVRVHRYVFSEEDVIRRDRWLHGRATAYHQVSTELDDTVRYGSCLDDKSGRTQAPRQNAMQELHRIDYTNEGTNLGYLNLENVISILVAQLKAR